MPDAEVQWDATAIQDACGDAAARGAACGQDVGLAGTAGSRTSSSGGFRGLLDASLAAIERDAPACARAIAAALGPAVIELVVDGEPIVVHGGRRVTLAPAGAGPDCGARAATTRLALLALLDGEDELAPAVIANRVRVRAAPADAERLFDAMRRFVEGCARTAEAPALLAAYRRGAGEPAISPDRRPT